MNPESSLSEGRPRGERLRQWSCLWGGGLAWTLHLLAIWLIAEFGCVGEARKPPGEGLSAVAWGILAATGICLGLAGWATRASWRRARSERGSEAKFLGRTGLVLNPLFALVILAETVPVFFYLEKCGSHIQ